LEIAQLIGWRNFSGHFLQQSNISTLIQLVRCSWCLSAIEAPAASKFTVEGKKPYWLHIALGRDLNADGSVDVLGTQLEEVTE